MQIMPEAWAAVRLHCVGADPYGCARTNPGRCVAYLREPHDRYGSQGFLAAYDARAAR